MPARARGIAKRAEKEEARRRAARIVRNVGVGTGLKARDSSARTLFGWVSSVVSRPQVTIHSLTLRGRTSGAWVSQSRATHPPPHSFTFFPARAVIFIKTSGDFLQLLSPRSLNAHFSRARIAPFLFADKIVASRASVFKCCYLITEGLEKKGGTKNFY